MRKKTRQSKPIFREVEYQRTDEMYEKLRENLRRYPRSTET